MEILFNLLLIFLLIFFKIVYMENLYVDNLKIQLENMRETIERMEAAETNPYIPFFDGKNGPKRSFESNKKCYNQNGRKINYISVPGEQCRRKCIPGENLVCNFNLKLEHYQAMGVACGNCATGNFSACLNPECISADGNERGILVFNRKLPSDDIWVCEDDILNITIENSALGVCTTIHWHGIHQYGTPWMDGTDYITQCCIPPLTTFQYVFLADQCGTHFYHSHTGLQKKDGVYGSLIVNCVDKFPYRKYCGEYIMVLSDWERAPSEQCYVGSPTICSQPPSILINGRGTQKDPITNGTILKAPITKYIIKPNCCYRFRAIGVISGALLFVVEIYKHILTIIQVNLTPVKPVNVSSFHCNSGERFDFVVCGDQNPGCYPIKVRDRNNRTKSYAVLCYEGYENETYDFNVPESGGISINEPFANCNNKTDDICMSELISLEKCKDCKPNATLYLEINLNSLTQSSVFGKNKTYTYFENVGGQSLFVGTINNITSSVPKQPMLTQYNEIDPTVFCNAFNKPTRCNNLSVCECTHVVRFPVGTCLEIVLFDMVPFACLSHPIHLHGHAFSIQCMGQNKSGIPVNTDYYKKIHRTRKGGICGTLQNEKPPLVDTVSLPCQGFAVLKVHLYNPGCWYLHCHYDKHNTVGMRLTIQVGDEWEWPKPPSNFPKCGDYKCKYLESLVNEVDPQCRNIKKFMMK